MLDLSAGDIEDEGEGAIRHGRSRRTAARRGLNIVFVKKRSCARLFLLAGVEPVGRTA
jgi:hypothetical protein